MSVDEIVPSDPIAMLVPAVSAETTFAVSVTSAEASIALSLLRSALVNAFDAVPLMVRASVSRVPSMSTSPEMSSDAAASCPVRVALPVFRTINLEDPLSCRSKSSLVAALAVSVALTSNEVNSFPPMFHVGVIVRLPSMSPPEPRAAPEFVATMDAVLVDWFTVTEFVD